MLFSGPVNRTSAAVEGQIVHLAITTGQGSHRIARAVGVSQTTVLRVLRRKKVDRREILRRNALVEEHRPLAHRIAKSVAAGMPTTLRDDLPAIADTALIDAAERFDPTLGVPFPAFMQIRVRGACLDACRRRHYTNATAVELDSQASETREDSAPNAELQAIEDETTRQKQALARQLLEKLSGRQAIIVYLHYIEGRSLEAIAPGLGVVPSRVSQLHREAITKLQGENKAA